MFGKKKKEAGSSSGPGKVDPHQAITRLKEQEAQLEKRKDVMQHRVDEVRWCCSWQLGSVRGRSSLRALMQAAAAGCLVRRWFCPSPPWVFEKEQVAGQQGTNKLKHVHTDHGMCTLLLHPRTSHVRSCEHAHSPSPIRHHPCFHACVSRRRPHHTHAHPCRR